MSVQDAPIIASPIAPPEFTVEISPDRERVIVALAGELDLATVDRVERSARELYDRGFTTVALDLRRLTFMDSSGLKLLLRLQDHARGDGRRFGIVDGEGPARRLLRLARLEQHFTRMPPAPAAIRLSLPV